MKRETSMIYRSLAEDGDMRRLTNHTNESIGAGFYNKNASHNKYHQVFNFYSGIYVIEGRGTLISAEGVRHELGPGSFFQRIPDREHTTLVDGSLPWLEAFINLPKRLYNLLCAYRVLVGDRDVLYVGKQERWLMDVEAFVLELARCPQYQMPSMVARAITLLQRIADEDRRRLLGVQQRQMETAIALLTGDLRGNRSIREIADATGIGYESFRKQFLRQYGTSPAQYRIEYRVNMAARWLAAGNGIQDVAFMAGYCDEFAFSKQFKKHLGMSPTEYKRAHKKRAPESERQT